MDYVEDTSNWLERGKPRVPQVVQYAGSGDVPVEANIIRRSGHCDVVVTFEDGKKASFPGEWLREQAEMFQRIADDRHQQGLRKAAR